MKKSIPMMAAIAAATLSHSAIYGETPRHVFSGIDLANRKPYPTMVTASREEIAEWNLNVKTRQVLRSEAKPWKNRNKRRMVTA